MLRIDGLLDRKPADLSGGQWQRVAIGRALVRDPKIFQFDEPLSNLDAKLRMEMRAEIKHLHRILGTTVVYVTHDQIEAMTFATRIAVMNKGVIEQIGTPEDNYSRPATVFVASFVGAPPMNMIEATLDAQGLKLDGSAQHLPFPGVCDPGRKVILGVRPEDIHLGDPDDDFTIETIIDFAVRTGPNVIVLSRLNGIPILASLPPHSHVIADEGARLTFSRRNLHVFDRESGKRIGL